MWGPLHPCVLAEMSLHFPRPCPLSFQPPASPPSLGSPTCARAAARESTLVRWRVGSGCMPWGSTAPRCWGSMQDPRGTLRGWEGVLAQRWDWGHRGMCPRSLQGWVLLEELLGAGLHLHPVACCHLPGGWHGLNSCPCPTSVTCEAAEGWERCGRPRCTGMSGDFVCRGDVPTGLAPPPPGMCAWGLV